ncbi:MAG: hypothetical protein VB071_05460 [Lawsonibacter sp.]|nr:hypothetical protein [Lawsonibacter sp.]
MSSNLREVNLERGMPRADQAIRQLTFELHRSRSLGFTALKLIHGYGSSGTGGRIRIEARSYLSRLQTRGEIAVLIPGEEFSIFNPATLDAFRRCGDLRKDRDLDRHNNGVTFVLL